MANRQGLGTTIGGGIGGLLGAILGSTVLPGLGTEAGWTIGSGLGGAAGGLGQRFANRKNPQYGQGPNALKELAMGSPAGFQQSSPYAEWETPYFQQAAQQGAQNLQNPYAGFESIENLARHNFQTQTIPTLAHRFSSMGSNALSSPVYNEINQQAGKDLELGLAALRAQYGMQNQENALRMLQFGTPLLYNNQWQEGTPGLMSLLGPEGAGPALGKLGASALGSYLGAAPGEGRSAAYSSIINGLKGI